MLAAYRQFRQGEDKVSAGIKVAELKKAVARANDAAAIAYDRVGLEEKPEVYDGIAAQECEKMEAALRAVAVEDEPNPAKINWYC